MRTLVAALLLALAVLIGLRIGYYVGRRSQSRPIDYHVGVADGRRKMLDELLLLDEGAWIWMTKRTKVTLL